MNYTEEIIDLLTIAISRISEQRVKTKHIGFIDDYKSVLCKLKKDVIDNNIPKTGTPRGLTRWLGEYIDQMDDKSILSIVSKIDELLATYY